MAKRVYVPRSNGTQPFPLRPSQEEWAGPQPVRAAISEIAVGSLAAEGTACRALTVRHGSWSVQVAMTITLGLGGQDDVVGAKAAEHGNRLERVLDGCRGSH